MGLLWVAASREASQACTYFLGKYYSQQYSNVELPHSELFQRGGLISWSEYLFTRNKYWGRSYFPVNNYWGVLFSGEYLLTVTHAQKRS